MLETKCEYHSNKNGILKCEKCGKSICIDCKRIYQDPHTSWQVFRDSKTFVYYIRREYCAPCYYDTIQDANKPMRIIIPFLILGSILLLLMIIFASIMLNPLDDPKLDDAQGIGAVLLFITLLCSIIVLIISIKKGLEAPEKIKQAKIDKDVFLKSLNPIKQSSLDHKTNGKTEPSTTQKSLKKSMEPIITNSVPKNQSEFIESSQKNEPILAFCDNCGKEIDLNKKFCTFCGESLETARKLRNIL